jgi:hypothetical protein
LRAAHSSFTDWAIVELGFDKYQCKASESVKIHRIGASRRYPRGVIRNSVHPDASAHPISFKSGMFVRSKEKCVMLNPSRCVAVLSFVFCVHSGCQAQTTIDVSKITCDQFTLSQVANPDYIAIWLSGYYHGKKNQTTIDVESLKANADKVRSYCLYNGTGSTLMQAVEKVLQTGP